MTQIMTIMEDFLSWRGFQYLRLDGSTKVMQNSGLMSWVLMKKNYSHTTYINFL